MQEYVLHGWSEAKCIKHKQNAAEGNFVTQCDRDGTCIYTGAPHVKLNYGEYELLHDVFDYANTKQILTQDRERRWSIIFLANKLAEMQLKKVELEGGNRERRIKNKG